MTIQDLQQIGELLDKKFDEKLDKLFEVRFGSIRQEIKQLLDCRLSETEEKIINKVTGAFNDIVDGFETGKADKLELRKLEKRVTKLEEIILD